MKPLAHIFLPYWWLLDKNYMGHWQCFFFTSKQIFGFFFAKPMDRINNIWKTDFGDSIFDQHSSERKSCVFPIWFLNEDCES